jgi:hypothetical protein
MCADASKAIVYTINNENDARKMCEILAMNGYLVEAETATTYSLSSHVNKVYHVYVEGGSTK